MDRSQKVLGPNQFPKFDQTSNIFKLLLTLAERFSVPHSNKNRYRAIMKIAI